MPARRTIAAALVGACLLATQAAAQSGYLGGHFCPADGNLVMSFNLYETAAVRLDVGAPFTGLPLRTLFDGQLAAGQHQVVFDGRDDAGELLAPGVYLATLVGPDGIIDDLIAIDCGDDLSLQPGTVIDGKDVNLPVSVNLGTYAEVDLGVYDATGTTRLGDFWQGNHSGTVTFLWRFELNGATLPAGDYVMRMTSPAYDEDVPFSIDPYTPLQMTTTLTDASGLPVFASEPADPPAPLKGPLQALAATFDRKLTPAEADFLTGRGLRYGGFLYEWARPEGPVVAPDSLGITWSAFATTRDWRDIHGYGGLETWGLCTGGQGGFMLGYDHAGITWRDRTCTPRGETDPDDWQLGPGPFWETPTGIIDAPCGNPLLLGEAAEIRIFLDARGVVRLHVVNADGLSVRVLVNGEVSAGYHTIFWDRTDNGGQEVPAGIYHLVWEGNGADRNRVVTSGDIVVSDLPAAAPEAPSVATRPTLLGNFPNPFNPATTIAFTLPAAARARLTVCALDGRVVAHLTDEVYPAGRHEVMWRGRDDAGRPVASGTYVCRLEADGATSSRRLLLLK